MSRTMEDNHVAHTMTLIKVMLPPTGDPESNIETHGEQGNM